MMMRRMVSLTMVLCLVSAAALAADMDQERKQGPTLSAWLTSIQQKMASMFPKKSISLSTGVAGVRGAKEDAQVRLYWKGNKAEEPVSEEELTEFRSAVELASKGERTAAIKELEEFMTEFPDSVLIPDAKKTLDLVKLEPEAKAAAEGNKEVQAQEAKPLPATSPEQKAETPAPARPIAAAPAPAAANP
jgi:hypothetical protein